MINVRENVSMKIKNDSRLIKKYTIKLTNEYKRSVMDFKNVDWAHKIQESLMSLIPNDRNDRFNKSLNI